MLKNNSVKVSNNNRVQIVDVIRGFTLFGILLLHSSEHFDLVRYPGRSLDFITHIDPILSKLVFFLFRGKAYAIFSLLFGFSFFIQMQNREEQGIDFRKRFLWRLAVLFVIGYIHSLLYIGDVLTVFAILGIPLVFLYKVRTKFLLLISVLLFIQIPTLINLLTSILNPDYIFYQYWGHWDEAIKTYTVGSLSDVLQFNAVTGITAKWLFIFNSGRYLEMMGLFIVGLVLGRIKYFENYTKYKKETIKVFLISAGCAAVFYSLRVMVPTLALNESRIDLLKMITVRYADLSFTFTLLSGFILTYLYVNDKISFDILSYYGRMSLTSYVSQTFFGVLFYYGFAFGMYKFFGLTLSMFYAVAVFIVQLFISKYWLKYFRYGPLEWLWRVLTFMNFKIKFRRTENI